MFLFLLFIFIYIILVNNKPTHTLKLISQEIEWVNFLFFYINKNNFIG